MTYQTTSASIMVFDVFKNKTINKEAQDIISAYVTDMKNIKNDITNIFKMKVQLFH